MELMILHEKLGYILFDMPGHVFLWTLMPLFFGISISHFSCYGQESQQKERTLPIENRSQIIHNLATHPKNPSQFNQSQSSENKTSPEQANNKSNNIVRNNARLRHSKPKEGAYSQIRLVDIQKGQIEDLKRKLATHRVEGKTVYVKKEVIKNIDRLKEEGISEVNLSDSGIVSLSVAEQSLDSNKENISNTSANTLATFVVEEEENGKKVYRITKEGSYEYKDGKKIRGGDKYDKIFEDGYKPLTPISFYYELSSKSHIDLRDDALQTFLSIPVRKQVKMIRECIKRSTGYVELDSLKLNSAKPAKRTYSD